MVVGQAVDGKLCSCVEMFWRVMRDGTVSVGSGDSEEVLLSATQVWEEILSAEHSCHSRVGAWRKMKWGQKGGNLDSGGK